MIPLREVRVLDRNAEALGVSVESLIARAGRAVADEARRMTPAGGSIVVLAGPGNNGADGREAARLLQAEGARVRVLSPREHAIADVEAACAEAALVVDALLGAGISGALRPPYDEWARVLSRHASKVLAVDVPTGFAFVPAATVTFHDIKEGMTEANSGRIVVAPIGIPAEADLYTGPGEFELYPRGRWDQHKGEGGIVLVIGGGPYTGAPAVAGLAALRAGADLAIVLTPQNAWQAVASYSPNLVVRPLAGSDAVNFDDPSNRVTLNSWLKKAKSVVLGPGLGLMAQAQKSVHHVLERAGREGVPVVVDADALTALAERKELLSANTVLTPHAREFKTLTGRELPPEPEKRADAVREAVRALGGGAWLLKGPIDVVADRERVKLNATGDPAMSVGGTGDALAGVVGALLAKGMTPFDAARLGARLNGEAGALAASEKSWGLLATDVVEALPAVLVRHLGAGQRPPRER